MLLRANDRIASPSATLDSPGSSISQLMSGRHVLDLSFEELTAGLQGSGKAKLFWEALRSGVDPLSAPEEEGLSQKARGLLNELLLAQKQNKVENEGVTRVPQGMYVV